MSQPQRPLIMSSQQPPSSSNGDLDGHNSSSQASVDSRFLRRLWGLVVLAKGWDVLLLLLVALVNIPVVSAMGKIPGSFYLALVDRDMAMFKAALRSSAGFYLLAASLAALQEGIADFLVVRWRSSLTKECHAAFCASGVLYPICSGMRATLPSSARNKSLLAVPFWSKERRPFRNDSTESRVKILDQELVEAEAAESLSAAPSEASTRPAFLVDNPDQRIAQEIQSFCQQLASLFQKVMVAPVMAAYFLAQVFHFVGWTGALVIVGFFLIGAFLSQQAMAPIAGLVARQERKEGDFRMAHVRVKESAESIALYRGEDVERSFLDRALKNVLDVQTELVWRRFCLEMVTKSFDYAGSVVNYVVMALVVFGGGWAGEVDKGKLSQKVSNASFVILQLIYSFSMLVDSSKIVSDMAGYTSRVGELFEAVELLPLNGKRRAQEFGQNASRAGAFSALLEASSFLNQKLKGAASQVMLWLGVNPMQDAMYSPLLSGHDAEASGSLVEEGLSVQPTDESAKKSLQTWCPTQAEPTVVGSSGDADHPEQAFVFSTSGSVLEVSIHEVPAELFAMLVGVFPGKWPADLRIVPTFQCGRVDLQLTAFRENHEALSGSSSGEDESSAKQRSDGWSRERKEGRAADSGLPSLEEVFAEMDRMLGVFLSWQQEVCKELRARGRWADAIDPRSGFPISYSEAEQHEVGDVAGNVLQPDVAQSLDSSSSMEASREETGGDVLVGSEESGVAADRKRKQVRGPVLRYSEVFVAGVLLGYDTLEDSVCPMIVHPRFGTRAYPASLLSDASADEIRAAIESVQQRHEAQQAAQGASLQSLAALLEKQKPEHSVPYHDSASQTGVSMTSKSPFLRTQDTDGTSLGLRDVDSLTSDALLDRPGGVCSVSGRILRPIADEFLFSVQVLTCVIPGTQRIVVKSLCMELGVRDRGLLITGPSGCGKTSLLRTLGGLWSHVEGSFVYRNPIGEYRPMILPQSPLLCGGASLAEQILYPSSMSNVSWTNDLEETLGSIMEMVGLGDLLSRIDFNWLEELQWESILSPGEKQKLQMCRVFVHAPQLVILDEVTSSLDEACESTIYKLLWERGIKYISVGHRSTLCQWHNLQLHLESDGYGSWKLHQL